ncbi:MAG: hypothetical protein NC306_15160 [Butyrivibrio sp.]|nr:hypothetical protein [Butyrivibrio sp.]
MTDFIYLEEKDPSLVDWMRDRCGITPLLLLDLLKHTTCRYRKEYEAYMAYVRRKYREEMELKRAALAGCPFLQEGAADSGNNGNNGNNV